MRRSFLKANVSRIIENLIESIYLAQPKVFSGGLNKE